MKLKNSMLYNNDCVYKLLIPGPMTVLGRLVAEDSEHYTFLGLMQVQTAAPDPNPEAEDRRQGLVMSPWLNAGIWTLLQKTQVIGVSCPSRAERGLWLTWADNDTGVRDALKHVVDDEKEREAWEAEGSW